MIDWLVLDVDGVVLDAERAGNGHWSIELLRRHGIERAQLREAFFQPHWADIVTGQIPIEPTLATALAAIGAEATAEEVLACWFDADFVPIRATIQLARFAGERGVQIALATNQEYRRAAYLRERLSAEFTFDEMIVSAEVGSQKPDQAFFESADAVLGLTSASNVLFVDDSEANVSAANEHGWRSVLADTDLDWIRGVQSSLALGSHS